MGIEFRGVTKQYPDGTVAVDDLSLTVEDGTITVFVGPSGCGKTTSLRMINRMVEPTSGAVLLDGKDVRESDPPVLRRGIGYVIQNAGLFPHRTVLDNVATVPLLSGWGKRKARDRAAELLTTVGLPEELGKRYPAQLSGGQQQRVGVARALAADSPVLLMDEPFSAVDPIVREGLQDELLRLQSRLGKTIVFVTHDIDEAVRLGDKVAVMRVGGKLAQYGTPAEVLRHPVDDFVASFVGRDRGYRGLSFVESDGVEVKDVATVALGETLAGAVGDWRLAVNADGHPRGWLAPETTVDGPLAEEDLVAGGSLYQRGTAVRGALDAALSSPSGLGVVVDDDGRVVGAVTARQILDVLESRA
ncbi:osmoprotectant transport system ATP-binding protein [Amycolatopsis bartoniae]|uniref:ABC-type quaternary amine transporter n=1 Tax=Amycolatopsis bartoniae TaxID=941986 RepID=A0A8H9IYC7_9PSEU|nr:ATP-binding cassette domain-containing protein [Amycolatopsis bartoniae]MBB2934532.1 osmoprotectant transport system ATP-binding protein [Amycolatopsis bartoniae]TVT06870.1 ATP-binding cassette domain-containing protein [Amycolatopsis bartoniae]GHF46678.1 proline/glycine betaine ABC transporter ATP-binding protein [Amycolatopsis bartoniae]